MKTNRIIRSAIRVSLALMLTLFILLLSSCSQFGGAEDILTKEELSLNVESSEDQGYEYASDYLDRWDFPRHSQKKLRALENVFDSKFVSEVGDPYERARLTAEAFLKDYYDTTELSDTTAVTDAIIRAYVSTMGDRYSIYRTAEEYREYSSDMSGSFVGIGVTVRYSQSDSIIRVEQVHHGSGAELAGILPGDVIYSVDGKTVAEMGYDASVSAIRGEENTTVVIGVLRGEEELSFTVKRMRVIEDSVTLTLDGDIAYIKISSFKNNTDTLFKEAIDKAIESGVRGIIYDLRDNPGGYLSSVTEMLDYICHKGTPIVSFTNDYSKPTLAKDDHTVDLPSVVICNGGTASAGELFTAGIRDFSAMGQLDAKIVGEVTFGKGIMQNTYSFSDGSSITLTVAYYNPPSGINYHGVGIEPDVTVAMTDTGDAQMDAAKEALLSLLAK